MAPGGKHRGAQAAGRALKRMKEVETNLLSLEIFGSIFGSDGESDLEDGEMPALEVVGAESPAEPPPEPPAEPPADCGPDAEQQCSGAAVR